MNTVVINEWLPNPAGNDAAGEFVELFNGGSTPVDLGGWFLVTKGIEKRTKLSGIMPANGYLVFNRKQTKLVLRNSDESLALYNAHGNLVDESSFIGSAPLGKSFNRINNPFDSAPERVATSPRRGEENIQNFTWGNPTPGAVNQAIAANAVAVYGGPTDVPINAASAGGGAFFGAMFGVAVLLAGLIVYSMRVNENLSDLFFSRDEFAG